CRRWPTPRAGGVATSGARGLTSGGVPYPVFAVRRGLPDRGRLARPRGDQWAGRTIDGAGPAGRERCGMGSQEFHDLANVTQATIWKGIAAVTCARIGIAETRRLREETRELNVQAQDARARWWGARAGRRSIRRRSHSLSGRRRDKATASPDGCPG